MTGPEAHRPVPFRTIFAVIGVVLATGVAIVVVQELARILGWLAVAAFFAIVLTPAVDFFERRRIRRGLATAVVFLIGVVAVAGLGYAFIRPVAERANAFVEELPGFVEDAKDGKGPVGRLVTRYNVDEYIEENQQELQQSLRDAGTSSLGLVQAIANTAFAMITILVLSFLMVLQAPQITAAALGVLNDEHRERIRRVSHECSRAVSGYVAGNLVISMIAGGATFVALALLDVPFSAVLALWVAFADLIPMVGATLGAIPTIGLAFLHSVPAGIVMLVFYVVYQQVENHFLQPAVMSRTVNLNPLTVLVSVLVGVELFGVLGALLAIPAAGIIQVVGRDLYGEHRRRQGTTAALEIPVVSRVTSESGTKESA